MRELNQKLLRWTKKECGTVRPEYYESFLKMSNEEMKFLIAAIMVDGAEYMNKKIFSGEWKDADIYDYFTYRLELMAQGILGIRENDGKLVISSPVEPQPDAEMAEKLDKKIKEAMPLIKEVFDASKNRRLGIMNAIKVFLIWIAKKRSIIGKIIISLIAIFAFYRCVINPPVYYGWFNHNKVYDKEYSKVKVPTVDINKLLPEMFGMTILTGLVYFLLVRSKDKG